MTTAHNEQSSEGRASPRSQSRGNTRETPKKTETGDEQFNALLRAKKVGYGQVGANPLPCLPFGRENTGMVHTSRCFAELDVKFINVVTANIEDSGGAN